MHGLEKTLAVLDYHPARLYGSAADLPVETVGKAVREYMHSGAEKNKGTPNKDALTFYTLNQIISVISEHRHKYEPLEGFELDALNMYIDFLSNEGRRAATYLLLITVRECRHTHTNVSLDTKLAKEVNQAAVKWVRQYKSGENYTSLWEDPPKCSFGALVRVIRRYFYEGSYAGGYGGPKWGAITDCLEAYVNGQTTAEMMLDTNWTLAHNGGPIFNKGMLYEMYNHTIVKLLDVQRSGQMVQHCLSPTFDHEHVSTDLKNLCSAVYEAYPANFETKYVNWYLVEALGSVNKYPHEKQAQLKQYGMTEAMKAAEAKAAEMKAAAEKAKLMEEAKKLAETYYVDVNTTLKKIKRAKAA